MQQPLYYAKSTSCGRRGELCSPAGDETSPLRILSMVYPILQQAQELSSYQFVNNAIDQERCYHNDNRQEPDHITGTHLSFGIQFIRQIEKIMGGKGYDQSAPSDDLAADQKECIRFIDQTILYQSCKTANQCPGNIENRQSDIQDTMEPVTLVHHEDVTYRA